MTQPHEIRYSYESVPTLRAFAASNAMIRLVEGPFGSGKSSACAIEGIRRGQQQRRGPDGIRHTRGAIIRNCFDDKTEILTEARGWQLFRDLDPEEAVATLKDGALTYEVPTYHYAAPYKGEMIGLSSHGLDMLVTPDHRLWTSARETRAKVWSAFRHETASDAYGLELRRFKRDATWDGADPGRSPAFFEFLGFWFAEGTAGAYEYADRKEPHWRLVVVQKNDLDAVRDILRNADLRWGEHISKESACTYFRIKIPPELKPLVRELAALGKAPSKHLPLWIKRASRAHLRSFLSGYLRGDGSMKTGPRNCTIGHTSSKRLADDIQEIGLKAGYVVNVGTKKAESRGKFRCNSDGKAYSLTFLQPSRSTPRARGWYKAPYDGMVYCVEVSTHVVFVRRNGKTMWCGQTFPELRDTTIKTFFQWFPPQYFGKYVEHKHTYSIKAFEGCDMEVLFVALDRPDDVKKLLSLELTWAWINEGREVPWSIFEALQGRIGRWPATRDGGASWYGMWSDTNPPDSDSKWYKFAEERTWLPDFLRLQREGEFPADMRPEDYAAVFRQPSGLSPEAENLGNLPGGRRYYANLASGKGKDWINVYIHGQYGFVVDGKPVFAEYNDRVHCQDVNPVAGPPIYRGWDFGLTPACTFSQILPDGRWLVFDEMVSESMGIDRFSDEVLEHSSRCFPRGATFIDIGDPAGEQRAQTDERTCFEILWAKGIEIEGGEQSVAIRLESIRKPLRTLGPSGEPNFVLNPRCKVLRKGFKGGYQYRRMQVSGERYTSVPDKNNYSHAMDSLEYVGTRLFGGGLTRPSEAGDDIDWDRPDYAAQASRSSVTGY